MKVLLVKADQGIEADCEKMVNVTVAEFGGLDIIVSNAVRALRCTAILGGRRLYTGADNHRAGRASPPFLT